MANLWSRAGALAVSAFAACASGAFAAPGEDPVVLQRAVNYLQLPTAPVAKSGDINYRKDVPDDMNAKVNRYMAKAYGVNTAGIATDRDVVQSVHTQGLKTTCYQSVGSTSAGPAGSKFMNNEQIVVLRGDLVNLCN